MFRGVPWSWKQSTLPTCITVAGLAARWAAEGWPARADDTGVALTAEYSAPSAGPPPWHVYRLTPRTATAVGTVEPGVRRGGGSSRAGQKRAGQHLARPAVIARGGSSVPGTEHAVTAHGV